jgi:hypothetical protein
MSRTRNQFSLVNPGGSVSWVGRPVVVLVFDDRADLD